MARVIHELTIDQWRPATVNQLSRSVRQRVRLKKIDRGIVALYALNANIPKATGRRRVHLQITLGPGQRECDPDNLWKSLLDALVQCGCLVNDAAKWCEPGRVTFRRGQQLETRIILEDQ